MGSATASRRAVLLTLATLPTGLAFRIVWKGTPKAGEGAASTLLPDSASKWLHPQQFAATRVPIEEARTLPGAVYHDEEFYQQEQDRVFRTSWVAAAELCDVANDGDVKPITIAGSHLLLINDKGTIRAFHNVCRHRGAKLITEPCAKSKSILCPYHNWGYGLDGRLRAMPSFDSLHGNGDVTNFANIKNFAKEENGLFPVRVEEFLGMAFINLNGKAPPLREWLGDLAPSVEDYDEAFSLRGPLGGLKPSDPSHRKVYDVAANWKVLIENYLEYYHLPAVHPELCCVSGVDEHRRHQGTGMYMCFATDPLTKGGTPIDPGRLPPLPTLGERNREMAYHVAIFPNTFFSLYPDAIFRIILSPQSAGRTLEHATLLTHDGARSAPDADKLLQETFEFWNLINTQDIEICKNVQLGTSATPYEGGRFSFRFEEPVHRFQNMIIDRMTSGVDGTPYHMPKGDPNYHDTGYARPTACAPQDGTQPEPVSAASEATAQATTPS